MGGFCGRISLTSAMSNDQIGKHIATWGANGAKSRFDDNT